MMVSLLWPGRALAGTVTVSVMLHEPPFGASVAGQALVSSTLVQPFDDDVVMVSAPAAVPVLVTVCWKILLVPGSALCGDGGVAALSTTTGVDGTHCGIDAVGLRNSEVLPALSVRVKIR